MMSDRIRKLRHFWNFWVEPVLPVRQAFHRIPDYRSYIDQWQHYQKMNFAEQLRFEDSYPCLTDKQNSTPIDPHYFYQAIWAANHIAALQDRIHIDIGSDVRYVSMLTAIKEVVFVDIRPLLAKIPNFSCISADILTLPFADKSIKSLSCLHVVEHIGLGRYGDKLNPAGTRQACSELNRVIAPGGSLLISLPIGKPRVQFNAHRIHDPHRVLEYLPDLELQEFSLVDDDGKFWPHADLSQGESSLYACGLYWFQRPI
jgi:SAM-dependent methyltransferase